MPLEKCRPRQSYVDILDRVLDKGLVIDAWLRVSVAGIEVVSVKAQVVVASIQTYVKSSATVDGSRRAAPSMASPPAPTALIPRKRPRRRASPGDLHTYYRCQHGCTFALRRRSGEK